MRSPQRVVRPSLAVFLLLLSVVSPLWSTSAASATSASDNLSGLTSTDIAAELSDVPELETPLHANSTSAFVPATAQAVRSSNGCPIPGVVEKGQADCDTALYEDSTSIAPDCRIPLILIHGIHGNQWPIQSAHPSADDPRNLPYTGYFSSLISKLKSKFAGFDSKYKIYRFHYRSDKHPVKEIARSLRNRLDELIRADKANLDKKFVIVAHSMGGLVARSYINDYNHDAGDYNGRRAGERILKLITLGTPHHGTQVANGAPRTPWSNPIWREALYQLDKKKWKADGCDECVGDVSHPNRGDLVWDNFDNSWSDRWSYTLHESEKNRLLKDISHSYDGLIYPYWGTIDEGLMINIVGKEDLQGLVTYLYVQSNAGYDNQALESVGVILHRIIKSNFDDKPSSIANDGFVPDTSARFDNFSDQSKQVHCFKTNHQDLQWGSPRKCERGSVQKSLIEFLVDDLRVDTPPPCPRVVVSSSLQLSPTANYTVGSPIKSNVVVTNRGTGSIVLNKLVVGRVGGACPNSICPDFTTQSNITLAPGQNFPYAGYFTPSKIGTYTFSVAYQKSDEQWVNPVTPENGAVNKLTINVTESKARIVVSNSLKISPATAPFALGQTLNGSFSITNRGLSPLAMKQILISGRVGDTCPNKVCPDFKPISVNIITLNPGQTHNYSGRITLSQPGTYLFRVAYQTLDDKWEIPVKTENGTVNQLSIVVQGALPTLTRRIPEVIFANPNYQFVNLYGTKLTGITYCTLKLPDGTKVFLYIPPGQVIKLGETQIRLKYKFLKRGTYYISASTLDGQSNEFPIIVN